MLKYKFIKLDWKGALAMTFELMTHLDGGWQVVSMSVTMDEVLVLAGLPV